MASTNNENNVKMTVYGMILPLVIGVLAVVVSITGFLIVKWMASVDTRLASIEADQKEILQLQYRVEMLERKAGISHLYEKDDNNGGDAVPKSSDYFLKPVDVVLSSRYVQKNKKRLA